MKNIFTLFFISMAFISNAQSKASTTHPGNSATKETTPAVKGPQISFNVQDVDYGKVKKSSDRIRNLTVTNTGNEPLVLTGCSGSCGCTVPACPTEPIVPGKSTTITINYDTERVGAFSKTITINSNSVTEPSKIINVHGEITAD